MINEALWVHAAYLEHALTNTSVDNHSASPRRIVVLGGGIGGAEAALTLAIGLPHDEVTLVSRWSSIRLLPDLVYVPFGVSARRIDVPISELLPHGVRTHGVRSIVAEVERVDVDARVLQTSGGLIRYDVLVAAPGAQLRGSRTHGLRTLDDAQRVRHELNALVRDADAGDHRTIMIRAASEDSWTAPACELALLTGAWIRSRGLEARVDTNLVTSDRSAFEWFGPDGETTIDAAMRRARVHVSTGVPAGRFDSLDGDLVIDFGRLTARTIDGLPGHGANGWYEPDLGFRVAPDTFVIGDAIRLLPDLVYVPFGVSARRIDVPISELLPHGVRNARQALPRPRCRDRSSCRWASRQAAGAAAARSRASLESQCPGCTARVPRRAA